MRMGARGFRSSCERTPRNSLLRRSASRSAASARTWSSSSVFVPNHRVMRPSASRSATARVRNHRYAPSCRASRSCTSSGAPERTARFQASSAAAASSAWTRVSHPSASSSSTALPVYSAHCRLRNSQRPAGLLVQTSWGIASSTSWTRRSASRSASSARLRSVTSRTTASRRSRPSMTARVRFTSTQNSRPVRCRARHSKMRAAPLAAARRCAIASPCPYGERPSLRSAIVEAISAVRGRPYISSARRFTSSVAPVSASWTKMASLTRWNTGP
ncbi:hypothetical protein AMOR_03320 [Anaeromyxobacter oryzae]|uniref:Uncharacterized protein n=1 Tax=Anaeromyxobacter oryzae TaxID=2918170 RepID=A0ABM7WPD5_9BACT|nr:hypothetical protein AMOR_03320 [Anaeromyxobacter oryzae]